MSEVLIFLLSLLTVGALGQSNHFEKYNGLINQQQDQLLKTIKTERGGQKIERIEKGEDSVRIVLRNKSPRETFTFFIANDTLRYIGVTLFKVTTSELKTILTAQFESRPLENLKDGIFEDYTNDKHVAHELFWNKQSKIAYLLVTYPELPAIYSNVVMWIRR